MRYTFDKHTSNKTSTGVLYSVWTNWVSLGRKLMVSELENTIAFKKQNKTKYKTQQKNQNTPPKKKENNQTKKKRLFSLRKRQFRDSVTEVF